MTAATSPEGAGAGTFKLFRAPESPFSTNPNQREPHAHDLAFGANGNVFVANPHVRPGPTGIASTITELDPNLNGAIRVYDIPNQPEAGNQTFTGGLARGPDNRMYFVSSEFTGDEEISALTQGNTSASAVQTYVITREGRGGLEPGGPMVSAQGAIWFTASLRDNPAPGGTAPVALGGGAIGRLDPATGQVTSFDSHIGHVPINMTMGPGGIWYTEQQRVRNAAGTGFMAGANGRIAMLNPNTGAGPHFDVPNSSPSGITVGGDGAIWFVSLSNPQGARAFIGRLDPRNGQVSEFPIPAGATLGSDIVTGRLGEVYYNIRPGGQGTPANTCSIVRLAVVCGGRLATVIGSSRNDTLQGTPGDDVVDGLAGNDNIETMGGNDVACGGAGNDFISSSGGADAVYGEDGNDHIVTGNGRDVAFGGAGYDRIFGGDGLDVIFGEAGTDALYGEEGNDQVFGGSDGDAVFGGMGNDFLFGEAGRDWLDGEAGTDRCDGGADSDSATRACESTVNVP
jgi:streptogramin lyase